MNAFKDAGHLFRFAGLFVLAFLVFLVIRGYVVPRSFGQYGHYRGNAIGDIAAQPIKFAGHETCEGCHTDVLDDEEGREACACELRSLPRAAGEACRRSGVGYTCKAGYGGAVRTLPHRVVQPSRRAFRRLIRRTTRAGFPVRPATSRTVRRSMREVRSEDLPTSFAGSSCRRRRLHGNPCWPELLNRLPTTRCPNTGGAC